MKYLFFDTECANCFDGIGKICEFGYVLTDENLNTLKSGIHLINPDAEFDWYVKHKIISYKINEYESAPLYPEIYNNYLKELLESEDTVLVGHGVSNDLGFINDEIKRYELPGIKSKVIDASHVLRDFRNEKNAKSLKLILKELGIGQTKALHSSEYDAAMTLEYVKHMCNESGLTFSALSQKHVRSVTLNGESQKSEAERAKTREKRMLAENLNPEILKKLTHLETLKEN